VRQGDNIPDLQVTGLNLNGGTILDAAGTALSGAVQADLALQVDTTPPATPAAPADSAVVNGYINAARDTAAQALTGSAEDGSTVTVYDNGNFVGSTAANATTGAWSYTIGQLADGSTHSYTVTATDAAGNVSQPSAALNFTVDITPPATPTAPADSAVVNGYVNAGHDTAAQALTGSAENGSTVTVYDNGNFIGSTAANATTGAWSFTIGQLADAGTHSYTVTATDVAGNTSQPSTALNFTVDITPPMTPAAPSDSAVVNGYVNAAHDTAAQALTGSAEKGSTVTVYDNGNFVGSTAANVTTGSWSYTIGRLADAATHGYTVTATDAAGNASQPSAALNFTVDITPPATPAAPADSAVVNGYVNAAHDTAAQALTGSAENSSTVTIYDNGSFVGSTAANVTTGSWSFTIGHLADASTHSYTVTASDAAGNVSQPSAALNFTVDITPPATPAAPADSAVVGGNVNAAHDTAAQALTGTVEKGSTVKIYDNGNFVGSTAANVTTGSWSFTIGHLADAGTHSYTVTATDAAGNTSQPSAALSFVVDTDAGQQAVLKLTIGTTAISAAAAASVPFTIAGLQPEDTGTVTFTDVNHKTVVISVTGNQTGYTANLSSLADGTITSSLAVNADAASNTFTPVAGSSATLTQLDHWIKASGGSWTTSSSWATWNGTHAVPTGTIDADFDTSGTYAVSITTADTAYGLLLNDSGAMVSDNGGGTLTLAGTGGSSSPNGMLTINAGTFALAGGVLNAGTISIASAGALLITGGYTGLPYAIVDNGSLTVSASSSFAGSISGAGAVVVQNGAAATFNGAITGSETFTIANASTAILNAAVNGSGSFTLSGSGSVEFAGADSDNVAFAVGATGTLKLDHSLTAPFTGYLSGLSLTDALDLADLAWKQGKMTASFSGTAAGGTLTVSNGKNSSHSSCWGIIRPPRGRFQRTLREVRASLIRQRPVCLPRTRMTAPCRRAAGRSTTRNPYWTFCGGTAKRTTPAYRRSTIAFWRRGKTLERPAQAAAPRRRTTVSTMAHRTLRSSAIPAATLRSGRSATVPLPATIRSAARTCTIGLLVWPISMAPAIISSRTLPAGKPGPRRSAVVRLPAPNRTAAPTPTIPSHASGTTSAPTRRIFCSAMPRPGIHGWRRSATVHLRAGVTSAAPARPTACP